MTHPIDVYGNKTLGAGDDGMIQLVHAAAIIGLPHEDDHDFVDGVDKFTIISNTDDNVSIVGEAGVTVMPLSSALLTAKGVSVQIEYQGNNVYLMWGSL